jgi:ubiquitin-protein ligase
MLRQPGNCPEGVYVSPSKSLDEWEGVIFVRKGYYQGGVFRFKIQFPVSYPLRAPLITFAKGSLIHPLIDPRDDHLALASGFPDWDPTKDNVVKLLFYIKNTFKTFHLNKLNDGLAINGEAWRLFQSNRAVFAKLTSQCATISATSTILYDQPTNSTNSTRDLSSTSASKSEDQHNAFKFRQMSEEEMNAIRQALFAEED